MHSQLQDSSQVQCISHFLCNPLHIWKLQVFLELPNLDQASLKTFDDQLMATHSEREQRNVIKGLLANSGRPFTHGMNLQANQFEHNPLEILTEENADRKVSAAVLTEVGHRYGRAGICAFRLEAPQSAVQPV